MKKIVLLAAFALLGGCLVSCDNETMSNGTNPGSYADGFSTDEGVIPLPPPPPPPPPPVKPRT